MQSPARLDGFPYDAFGSYTTRTDYRLVRRVEGFLESFHRLAKPVGDLLPELAICVDGSDFSIAKAAADARKQQGASPTKIEDEIQRVITGKLEESWRLLLFCSGQKLLGLWMNWEIAWWAANRGLDSVFIVVTSGDDPWGNAEEFFPKAIIEHSLHRRVPAASALTGPCRSEQSAPPPATAS